MFAKTYHLDWIAGRANILRKYIIYLLFNCGRGYCGFFPMSFPKAPASCCKKILNQFLLHCPSTFMSLKSVSHIFKILFQTGYINIFVLCGVFFSRYAQLKSLFSDEKSISSGIRDTLQQRSYRKSTWQSIKGKFHHWQKLELCKVIHSAKLH